MRLTARSISATFAALLCIAGAGAAAAQTVRNHSVRMTRSAGALPPMTYSSTFADPWSGAGWGGFPAWDSWPAWGAWPTAGAGAWTTARAGAPSAEMARMMPEMDRDMAAMRSEMDAMMGPIGWAGASWPSMPYGAGMARPALAPAGPGWTQNGASASGYSWSSHTVDDGRCVRNTTTSQTLGGAPQTATRTDGRC